LSGVTVSSGLVANMAFAFTRDDSGLLACDSGFFTFVCITIVLVVEAFFVFEGFSTSYGSCEVLYSEESAACHCGGKTSIQGCSWEWLVHSLARITTER
jgi:hypothetical protein